jgi:cobalt-zinc-cadmium resistance protein CzcA
MLQKIISFSIQNKLIISLATLALIIVGAINVSKLPVDAVPDITNNQVQIITQAPSLGTPDVERLITFPIEQVNNNIPGLVEMRSFSRFGLSVVTLVFNDDTDIYWARQQVAERLQMARDQIPAGAGMPTLAPVTTGLGEIYQYTVRAETGYEHQYSAMDLRTIQDWIVRRQLLGVTGVAEVSSFGGLLKEYEIAVVPEKLYAYNININDVFSALESNNQNTGGSYIEKGPTVLFIRSEGLIGSISDIESILVKNLPDGTPLLIGDVAEVKYGHAARYGALTYNGEQQVSGAVVMMLKGANSNEVISNIKEKIEEIRKTLPEGVTIDPFLDRTKMVNNAVSTVVKNLIEGALIVIFILVLFLGNFRAGILVASVIPLSMLFAIILMNTFGVSGNLMSLGALDFGLIVDGAVIIVEAVLHALTHGRRLGKVALITQKEMDTEVKNSASRLMSSAVFGQIIILIVYIPILALQGIEGKMFKPMAQTVAFALIGAFILSLTYVPVMSTILLSKKLNHGETFSDRIIHRMQMIYSRSLLFIMRRKQILLLTIAGVFVFSLFLLSRLGGEFIPSLPEGDFAVETRVLPGSNLNTSIEAVSQASKLLLAKFPEISQVVGKTGSSEVPTDPMPIDASDLMIILKDKSEWTSAETYAELEKKMSDELSSIPGVTFGFQYPVAMRFNELISGARQDVVCKIFGEDMDTLARLAGELGNIASGVEGTEALYVESVTGMPQILINYKRETIAQYGLNISGINRVVNTAFAGESTGLVYEGEKRFNLVVRLSSPNRNNLEDVRNLLIPAPNQKQIPLHLLADVNITEGPNQIQRENSHRRIIVGFNVRERDIQTTVKELQQKVEKQLKLPVGYYVTYGGAFENLNAAKSRLMVAVPISLALIFILLYFAFSSVKKGVLIYSTIPLSAIGGILALYLRDMPFSVSAGIGFIALFGVAVLNGIVLIAEFNRIKGHGIDNLHFIAVKGSITRLRPILITAFVASLGFLPMALSQGEGAEVQRPLATVVIGGLLLATFLTLFVLPVLYVIFHQKGKSVAGLKSAGVLLFAIILVAPDTNAQSRISLNEAVQLALENNLSVKNDRLRAEYREKLIGTAYEIPSLSAGGEYGQINSSFADQKFGINQSFSFPTVYSSQKEVLLQQWKSSQILTELKESELKKEVSQTYIALIHLSQKKNLLLRNDSLYASFLERANLRFEKGESNITEKLAAEQQRGQIAIQLRQLENEEQIVKLRFQILLNTEQVYDVIAAELTEPEVSNTLTPNATSHPLVRYGEQKKIIAGAVTKAEQARRLPGFSFGYNIMGMQGTGADNIVYDNSLKFQSVQWSLDIPIFQRSQKSRVQAARVDELIASGESEEYRKIFIADYNAALIEYRTHSETVRYYEDIALNNARKLASTADLQLRAGEINYMEWIFLINQSISIESDYLDALKRKNESIIKLGFYSIK